MADDASLLAIDLEPDESLMLVHGLSDWGGPAYGSDPLAVAMGWADLHDLDVQSDQLIDDIVCRRPMSIRDWTRALVATEFAFGSSVLGSADEWRTITGIDEATSLQTLQRLRRKLPADPDLL